jgi:hypothetical protein
MYYNNWILKNLLYVNATKKTISGIKGMIRRLSATSNMLKIVKIEKKHISK